MNQTLTIKLLDGSTIKVELSNVIGMNFSYAKLELEKNKLAIDSIEIGRAE